MNYLYSFNLFFFQAEDGIRDATVTGVQTCALPISPRAPPRPGAVPGRRGTGTRPRRPVARGAARHRGLSLGSAGSRSPREHHPRRGRRSARPIARSSGPPSRPRQRGGVRGDWVPQAWPAGRGRRLPPWDMHRPYRVLAASWDTGGVSRHGTPRGVEREAAPKRPLRGRGGRARPDPGRTGRAALLELELGQGRCRGAGAPGPGTLRAVPVLEPADARPAAVPAVVGLGRERARRARRPRHE